MRILIIVIVTIYVSFCNNYVLCMADGIPSTTVQFSPAILSSIPRINYRPIVVKRIKNEKEILLLQREKAGWPYEAPTGMVISIDNDMYVFYSRKLLVGRLDVDTMTTYNFPRAIPNDKLRSYAVDQWAVYSPTTGKLPNVNILRRIDDDEKPIVGKFQLHDGELTWCHYFQAEQVLPLEDLQDIDLRTWGTALALDKEGNGYIGYWDKDHKTYKAALFDIEGRFIKRVPSTLIDAEGYFYLKGKDGLMIFNPQGQLSTKVTFPSDSHPGNLTADPLQVTANGVWVRISLDNKFNQAFVLFGSDGQAVQWFDVDATKLRGDLQRVLLNPFFSVDGKFFYSAGIQVRKMEDGVEEATYIIFCTPLLKVESKAD